ncbi:hypothetical protein SKAU_G00366270 [Synaphobranchus kaupii]|uniref:Protein sel-1 homolog 3-like n=1 Tax=Synaphobranchus kaupii TaxID=118154 RepID=A0A9Q1EF60_SYNKA|nr:hypothetical protein SKAU_G00366270 [Synaphobranchus kaupii]
MKVSGSFRFIASVAFAVGVLSLAQSGSTYQTTTTPEHPGEVATEDFVRFGNAPDVVIDGYVLSVLYRCSRPCAVRVEVLASYGLRTGVTVFRRSWTRRKRLSAPRTRPLVLRIPDAIAYRQDYFVRRTVDASDVTLMAWIDHLERPEGGEAGLHGDGSYHQAPALAFRILASVPPYLRPVKKHNKCPSWGAELRWQLTNQTQDRQCLKESGLVDLLKFPLASTGERFGMIHRFYPFINKELELIRLQATLNPRATLSVWIYLLSWCSSELCAVIHHVDSNNKYHTPLIMLNNRGDIVFQVRLASGGDQAFISHTPLNLRTWHHLQCFIHGNRALRENEKATNSPTSKCLYSDMRISLGRQTCRAPPWSQRAQELYRPLLEVLQNTDPKFLSRISGLGVRRGALRFGERVFELVLQRLSQGDPPDFGRVPALIPLLQLSSCLGHHRATYLLAVTHLAGLGMPTDTLQGHVYSLIAAQKDERLALMHLGYKHMQGIDGFPKDHSMAYCYYANVGKQTCADRWKLQSTKQYPTEQVLLSDDRALQSQMDQNDDVFLYLQFQADRGDLDSQKALARILFWGQRGVHKDIGTAVKLFAKIAMETNDALSMYDYSIILFKGQGVKKNTTLALKLLEKAASMGSLEALNGLGWYYSTFMADIESAVKYFEKAAMNGSKDAVFNLGVIYLNGNYPGKPGKNETAAFQHFLSAAILGHFEAAVLTASYYATGNLHSVHRNPESAVRILKSVSERNGYLGYTLRTGLRAYLRGSRQEALLSYIIAAESGFGVAQNNAAHLCEELGPNSQCEWRYHNQSTYNDLPHHTGFLKMGDYFYHGLGSQPQDIKMAASLYSRASLYGSAQGIYNLAVLMEEGHRVPEKLLEQLNVSSGFGRDDDEVLEKLYQRCRENEEDLDLSPCSLALFRVLLKRAWRTFINHPVQRLLVYVTGTAIMAAVISSVLQNLSNRASTAPPRTRSPIIRDTNQGAEPSPANQHEVTRNGQLGPQFIISRQTLKLVGDWSFTVVGVGLCTMSTVLMFHLL